MRACGLIVEYNPFHFGHRYHLQQARQKSKADVMIAVMSGNFVQRGEPAFLDKWTRTHLALQEGVDLVLELPWYGAVQAADYFAQAAVQLLALAQVDAFCFGTEKANFPYMALAQKEQQQSDTLKACMKKVQKQHPKWKHAQVMSEVYHQLFPDEVQAMDQSNHLLGLAYARANVQLKQPLTLYTLERQGSQHRDTFLQTYASGTAIRQACFEQEWERLASYVPESTFLALQRQVQLSWEAFWPQLQVQALSLSDEEWASLYEIHSGLAQHLQKAFLQANSFKEWLNVVQRAHLSKAKAQRLACYILTHTKEAEVLWARQHPYLKVLGMNEKGRVWLKTHHFTCPLITNIRQQEKTALRLEQRYDCIYLSALHQQKQYFSLYHPIFIAESRKE